MRKILPILCILGLTLMLVPCSYAVNINFSTAGNGTFDILDVREFDWDSTGNLVIEDALVSSSTNDTSFSIWASTGVVGDTAVFNIHAQDRLSGFLLEDNTFVPVPTGSEITLTLDGVEGATIVQPFGVNTGIIAFDLGISGTVNFWLDDSPDSNPVTGAGYRDGINFLTASLDSVIGNFGPVSGAPLLEALMTATGTDPLVIQAVDGTTLNDVTFDSIIRVPSSSDPIIADGGTIGQSYTVLTADLRLNADGNTEFSSVPEPATMLLLGAGLVGMACLGRRKKLFKK